MVDEVRKSEKEEEKPIKVNVVAKGEKMTLVELNEDGVLKRISIPNKELKDGMVAPSVLNRGVRFGIPYEELEFPKVTAKNIAIIMRNNGLWTPDDIRQHPLVFHSAVSQIYSETVSAILNYIKGK